MTTTTPTAVSKALPTYQYIKDYCDSLNQNFKNHTVSSYERHLSASDSEWSTKYYTQRLEEVNNGTAGLNRFVAYEGRKYIKIVMQEFDDMGPSPSLKYRDGSVHAFVDKKTGDVYKPAGYNKPAKHVRYNIMNWDHRKFLLNPKCIDWAGGYLYMR
jgi:hypothetical protein